MKKVLAILLALVLVIGVFAACTNNSEEPNDTSASQGENANDTSAAESEEVASDLQYIKDRGEMIIGYTEFAPMNYKDDEGNFVGFETEFATAVCEKLGITPKFQLIKWETKETELKAKTIDCIWNGMTISPERLEEMSISTPYMANKQVLIVKAENADKYTTKEALKGAKIVAEAESAGETVAKEDEFFAESEYTAVVGQAQALMEVSSGIADGCVVDYVLSIGMIGEGTDYENLVVVDELAFNDEEYGIAFRKGSDVTAAVNEAITALVEEGKLAEIAAKYKLQEQLIAK